MADAGVLVTVLWEGMYAVAKFVAIFNVTVTMMVGFRYKRLSNNTTLHLLSELWVLLIVAGCPLDDVVVAVLRPWLDCCRIERGETRGTG